MQGRLGKTIRHPVMKLLVDFNEVGYDRRNEWVDITDDILEINGSKEKSGKQIGSVSSDIATFIVDNADKKFSNNNTKSPLYGKIKSNLKFQLLTGFQGETLIPYASGIVESFVPAWRDKRISIKTSDFFKLFKDTPPPEDGFQDISWDSLVNILCDHVGLPSFIARSIPRTEFQYSYFKFEEDNCFESLKALMEVAVGEAFFEQEKFYVKTKLALDYQLDTTIDHDITVDDLLDFEESVDGQTIINDLTISSSYKSLAPLGIVFDTPENIVKVDNELIVYKGNGEFYVNPDNLPIVHTVDSPMSVVNITKQKNIRTNGHVPNTGKFVIHPDDLDDVSVGDNLSVMYHYQQLALLSSKTRKFVFILNSEVDSLQALDIAVWDENGATQRAFTTTPDTPNTVSQQGLVFDKKTNTVTLTLKNNYNSPITISTLQFRGYPIKVYAPIEVFVKDLPSIEELGRKELSVQNNYINNIRLAEKIGQYIVDNNKANRKRISIEIPAYPEFSLDDISKVTEESSGTSHSFTNERIDYSFTADGGWSVKAELLELDTAPWVYESFKGESWEKTNSGVPDNDFLKDISANLIKNGGAELYTGFADYDDVQAISQRHIVADYWLFERLTGNASARIRDGGNLVLHGLHSFEITTSNSGTGYFHQLIQGVKTNSTYILSLVVAVEACTGKATIEQYANDTMIKSDSIMITSDGPKELMISSLSTTSSIVVKIEKLAGTAGSESLIFDKVKFENAKAKTPYIENEETTSIQMGQRYANSLVLGNNYGIEVFDEHNNSRVRIGQYRPNTYGIQVFGGAIEIINGLPESQIAPEATGKWNDAAQWVNDYADDSILSPVEKREIALQWQKLDSEYNSLIIQASGYWEASESVLERDTLTQRRNELNTYLNVTPDEPNGWPILGQYNMTNRSDIDRDQYNTVFTNMYNAISEMTARLVAKSQEIANEYDDEIADLENKITYKCEVFCFEGNFFKNGQGSKTLHAIVYQGPHDVTDTLAASQFNWKLISGDATRDNAFNAEHKGAGKTITIHADDIDVTAVISCEISVDIPV
jgi:hypothetical protein